MVRIVALVAVVALAAMPAAALAAPGDSQQAPAPAVQEQPLLQNPVQEAPPAATTPAPAPVQQTEADGTIGRGQLVVIALVIVGLIGGIWFAIARDARKATAGRTHAHAAGSEDAAGRGGSATRAARRSRKPSAAERQRRKRGRAR
jgi:hypothetical protein